MLPCMGARQTVIVVVVEPPWPSPSPDRWTSPRRVVTVEALRLDPRSVG